MAVNKVIYNGETLVDLTGDTVTPDSLLVGATAHDASGRAITGTVSASSPSDARIPVAGTVTNYGCVAASVSNFTLTDGAEVLVKFVNASVWYDPDGYFPSLNVSGTGYIDIDDGVHGQHDLGVFFDAGDVVRFVYNATANRWVVRENLTTRTTYGESIAAEKAAQALRKESISLFSNTMKGKVRANPVEINDISPIPHDVKVFASNWATAPTIILEVSGNEYLNNSVAGDNGLAVEVDGNNVSVSFAYMDGNTLSAQILRQTILQDGTYTFSCRFLQAGTVTSSSRPNEILVYVNGQLVSVMKLKSGGVSETYVLSAGDEIRMSFFPSVTSGASFSSNYMATFANIRFERPMETVTIPNGGTVPSRYPNMKIKYSDATDHYWVLYDVEYNKDLNKVVEQLTNAIISLGGTI